VPGIFISYRRGETNAYAGRLYDALSARFGEQQVFMDIDTIEPGTDFVAHIGEAVASCDALLALIGRDWLDCRDAKGCRRLEDPRDFVRVEISTGLQRGVRVIPILVHGATMPTEDELPEPLAHLARRNAFEMSDVRWRDDVGHLAATLQKALAGVEGQGPADRPARSPERARLAVALAAVRRRPGLTAAVIGAAAVLATAAALLIGGGGHHGGSRVARAKARSTTVAGLARERYHVGAAPIAVAVSPGSVWVVNHDDGTVRRIDAQRRTVADRPIRVGINAWSIAADRSGVWVTSSGDTAGDRGSVRRIDPRSTAIGAPIRPGRNPAGVAIDGGSIWVVNGGDRTVARIDAATGAVTGTVSVGAAGDVPIDLAVARGGVWVPLEYENVVVVIDARTMRRIDRIDVRAPTAIAFGYGALWVANSSEDTVSRIDPSTRTVVARIRVGRDPEAVSAGAGGVWVANQAEDSVTRIDPATNRVVGRPIAVGDSPDHLVAGLGSVWVPNSRDDTVTRIEPR
jgi:YVTN family beta-propeller protein